MCGIVGAVAQRDVAEILVEGLKRLEYRGYDSAGVAIVDNNNQLNRARRLGKVQELADALQANPISGGTGIAHTRWATHGVPNDINSHPHISNSGNLFIVNASADSLDASSLFITNDTSFNVSLGSIVMTTSSSKAPYVFPSPLICMGEAGAFVPIPKPPLASKSTWFGPVVEDELV